MSGGESIGDVRNPPMWMILRACPQLNWRACRECGLIALYRDNILPACRCHDCKSADTRIRPKDNLAMFCASAASVATDIPALGEERTKGAACDG